MRTYCTHKITPIFHVDPRFSQHFYKTLESGLKFVCSDLYQVKNDKLVLLDVGSCFNAFQAFSDIFIPLAIDLCPADKVSLYSMYGK